MLKVLRAQKNEITEHIVYRKLASIAKIAAHVQILQKISAEELQHYGLFKAITRQDVSADKFKIFLYYFLAKMFGLNFGLKLMEGGEGHAQVVYDKLKGVSSAIEKMMRDENSHEQELIGMIDEERMKYISSMVLGLNDALVELSGALVGFTLALQNTRLVAIVGLITGIAAAMSMAASEYLSTKQEDTGKSPLKACIYTGLTYIGTVILLVLPYFIFKNIFFCLTLVLADVFLIILIFTFYMSVAKGLNFRRRFLEMAGISLSIAGINFVIGLMIRKVFGIDV